MLAAPMTLRFRDRLGAFFLRRREWLWVPALMVFVAFWVHRSIWTGHWLGRDAIEVAWPNLAQVAESFRHGEWPLWNPYDRGGHPVAADPQVALHYPLTWLFALTGLRGVTPALTIQVLIVLHLAIAGILLHAWLRTR